MTMRRGTPAVSVRLLPPFAPFLPSVGQTRHCGSHTSCRTRPCPGVSWRTPMSLGHLARVGHRHVSERLAAYGTVILREPTPIVACDGVRRRFSFVSVICLHPSWPIDVHVLPCGLEPCGSSSLWGLADLFVTFAAGLSFQDGRQLRQVPNHPGEPFLAIPVQGHLRRFYEPCHPQAICPSGYLRKLLSSCRRHAPPPFDKALRR